MAACVGFRQRAIGYRRDDRAAGKSKYTVRKLFKLALAGIASFSERPLLLIATAIGALVTLLAFTYSLVIVAIHFVDDERLPPGYVSLLGAILFLAGVQLLTIGLLGTYIGRIYRENKARPLYLVSEEFGAVPPSRADRGATENSSEWSGHSE